MPIYEYRCEACGHEFEEWQKMSDEPIRVCPQCHARKVEKLISHSSFQLKGSGWYITDYGRRGSGEGGKKKSPKKDTDGGSGTSGADGASGAGAGSGGDSSKSAAGEAGASVGAQAA
jgi:putative FmdB family regulatory protein